MIWNFPHLIGLSNTLVSEYVGGGSKVGMTWSSILKVVWHGALISTLQPDRDLFCISELIIQFADIVFIWWRKNKKRKISHIEEASDIQRNFIVVLLCFKTLFPKNDVSEIQKFINIKDNWKKWKPSFHYLNFLVPVELICYIFLIIKFVRIGNRKRCFTENAKSSQIPVITQTKLN